MNVVTNLLQYFFDPAPANNFQYLTIFLALSVGFIVGAVIIKILLKKKKEDKIFRKLFRPLPGQLATIGICLAVYTGARYEKIPFLSMRFLSYLLGAWALFVILQNLQHLTKDYPKAKKHHAEQIKLNQYLPRKKH